MPTFQREGRAYFIENFKQQSDSLDNLEQEMIEFYESLCKICNGIPVKINVINPLAYIYVLVH